MFRHSKNFSHLWGFLVLIICSFIHGNWGMYHNLFDKENQLYEYIDTAYSLHEVAKGDSEFIELNLAQPIHFYSEQYDTIFINTNGILTFNVEFPEYINQPLPLEYPSIAPFFANVDTTGAGEATSISIFESEDPDQLDRATKFVLFAFEDKYDFEAKKLIVATWKDVGYFSAKNDKLNTFQVILIVNDEETFVQFIYPDRGINWVRAETGELGLPDIRGQAGFVAEDGNVFTLEDSGTSHVRFLSENSNVGISGVWLYRVGPLNHMENVESPTNTAFLTEPPVYQQETCAEGSHKYCDENADCSDKNQGFCCTCQVGYFGNGHVCLQNDIPVRISGTLSGFINGQPVEESAKLQSYVSTTDAHTYTAITPVAPEYASLLRLAIPLVTSIGWLFAKPINGALNGYQLTGGELKHYSKLNFDSGEVLLINQTFEGLNYWDQLSVKIDIQGDVPYVNSASALSLPDFIEEYRFISPNQIHSMQTIQLHVENENRVIQFDMDQSINFERCLLDEEADPQETTVLQKVSRVVLDYSQRDQAWRPSALTKIGVDAESNACNDGTAQCGENTFCSPYEDTYRCDCLHGYAPELDEYGVERCVDIDECSLGIHTCDEKAFCSNILGGFACVCYEGYEGDGSNCFLPGAELPAENFETFTTSTPSLPSVPSAPPSVSTPPSIPTIPNISDEHTNEVDYMPYPEPTENTHSSDDCKRCSVDSDCYNGHCICREGFDGDGYICNSKCKAGEIWEDGKCFSLFHGPNEDMEIEPRCNLFGDCTCIEGYELDPERQMCRFIGNNGFDDQVSCAVANNCHPNAECEWHAGILRYTCQCKPGFLGNGYYCSSGEESCAIKPEICDPHANCNYNDDLGKSECQCDRGYEGDGFHCSLAPECFGANDCGVNAYCDNGVCQCNDGFERDLVDVCVPVGRCGLNYCGPNALCKYDVMQNVQYCECMEGYEGDALIGCKSIPPPCNVLNNCGLNARCEPTEDPKRFECQCNVGYHGDGYVCMEDANCLYHPHMCDMNARCSSTNNGLVCVCNEGFYGNGSICFERKQHDSGFLLVSQGVAIVRVPLNGKNIRPIAITSMAIALDKDCLEGRLYWGDISIKKIRSAKYDGTDLKDFIVDDIKSPEGIAIDSISRRIYWTDSDRDTIEVASLDDPTKRAVLIHKNLVNPRGIAVDPYREKLYWSDWNRESPKIEMSDLDGTAREVLLGSDKVQLPNSLVVLQDTGELCFADAGKKTVECVDGFNRQHRIISNDLSYPFGLGFTQNVFYWTDWTTKKLESVDGFGVRQKGMQTLFFGSHKMYGMTAVEDECPLADSPCQNNGGCPDDRLCLVNRQAPAGKSCKCIISATACGAPSPGVFAIFS